MPYASSYATAQDPPKTMLSELDMQQAGQRMQSKFIRNNRGPLSEGVTGTQEGYSARSDPEMHMRMGGGMDPRWVDPPQRPIPHESIEAFRPGLQSRQPEQKAAMQQRGPITAAAIANRIFSRPSEYVAALDDPDSPLHSVAISLLANRRIAGTDRYVYILIICVLAIALTCSLYRINKQGAKVV